MEIPKGMAMLFKSMGIDPVEITAQVGQFANVAKEAKDELSAIRNGVVGLSEQAERHHIAVCGKLEEIELLIRASASGDEIGAPDGLDEIEYGGIAYLSDIQVSSDKSDANGDIELDASGSSDTVASVGDGTAEHTSETKSVGSETESINATPRS